MTEQEEKKIAENWFAKQMKNVSRLVYQPNPPKQECLTCLPKQECLTCLRNELLEKIAYLTQRVYALEGLNGLYKNQE